MYFEISVMSVEQIPLFQSPVKEGGRLNVMFTVTHVIVLFKRRTMKERPGNERGDSQLLVNTVNR